MKDLKILHIGLMVSDQNNTGGWTRALVDNFKDVLEIPLSYPDWNTKCRDVAAQFKPDIIFLQIQHEGVITEETARELSKHGMVINWTGDVRQPIPKWFYDIGQHIHLTAFSNEHDVNVFKQTHPAAYLQIGIDEKIYRSGYDALPCPEVVFMGNNYGDAFPLSQSRRDLVAHMKKHFGHKFAVFGNGWPGADSLMHSQPLEAQMYNSALIGINYNHYDLDRFSSDRVFRILGSGCFCLSQHYEGIEKDFEIGKHLDTFRNLTELTEKTSYYLNNPDKRTLIARQGQVLCHERFTFDAMAKELITIYQTHKK